MKCRNRHRPKIRWIVLTVMLCILFPVSPAMAFDPTVAFKQVFTIAQYVIIIAAIIGALKAISKMQILGAFFAVIAAAVIFSMVEPEVFHSLGSDILSYLSIIGGSGADPVLNPAPVSNTPSTPVP